MCWATPVVTLQDTGVKLRRTDFIHLLKVFANSVSEYFLGPLHIYSIESKHITVCVCSAWRHMEAAVQCGSGFGTDQPQDHASGWFEEHSLVNTAEAPEAGDRPPCYECREDHWGTPASCCYRGNVAQILQHYSQQTEEKQKPSFA